MSCLFFSGLFELDFAHEVGDFDLRGGAVDRFAENGDVLKCHVLDGGGFVHAGEEKLSEEIALLAVDGYVFEGTGRKTPTFRVGPLPTAAAHRFGHQENRVGTVGVNANVLKMYV